MSDVIFSNISPLAATGFSLTVQIRWQQITAPLIALAKTGNKTGPETNCNHINHFLSESNKSAIASFSLIIFQPLSFSMKHICQLIQSRVFIMDGVKTLEAGQRL